MDTGDKTMTKPEGWTPRPEMVEPMKKVVRCVFVRRVDPNPFHGEHRHFEVPRFDFRITFECGHHDMKRTRGVVIECGETQPRSTGSFKRGRCPRCPEVPR